MDLPTLLLPPGEGKIWKTSAPGSGLLRQKAGVPAAASGTESSEQILQQGLWELGPLGLEGVQWCQVHLGLLGLSLRVLSLTHFCHPIMRSLFLGFGCGTGEVMTDTLLSEESSNVRFHQIEEDLSLCKEILGFNPFCCYSSV